MVLRPGEVSRPDAAAILASALRLGVVDGGAGTHPGRVRDSGARQRGPSGRARRRSKLGRARTARLPPREQPPGRIRQQGDAEARVSSRREGVASTPRRRQVSLAAKKSDGVLPMTL